MHVDNDACSVCGSTVELRPHVSQPRSGTDPDGTTDERVCSDPDCASNADRPVADTPDP